MHITIALRLITLITGIVFIGASQAQSLTVKKTSGNFVIEATAPADNPHNLQASENWLLWVDVQEGITGPVTLPLNTTSAVQRVYRLISTPPEPEPIRVMYLGDSMGSDCCGWGRGTYQYFKSSATVINYSIPSTSTKVFLASQEKENMLLIKPDYVLINYGFVDGGTSTNVSTPLEEFEANLRTIVQMVRSFNGVPIMVTVHVGRLWDAQGKIIVNPTMEFRNQITRRLATELRLPIVDLHKLTLDYFNELGSERTVFMNLPGFPGDNVHFSELGAQHVARLLLSNLPGRFGPYLTGIFERPPIP